jgi:4-hydroxybenzoate polyprenyltransferase
VPREPSCAPAPVLPLVVDLDGTLARVDTLHEQLVLLLLRKPWQLVPTLFALFRSRARFKAELVRRFPGPAAPVPYNEAVLAAIAPHSGQPPIICTASNQIRAAAVCAASGLAITIFGSDADTNLKGGQKAEFLRRRFGSRGFIYYGNDASDLDVWREAAKAVVVSDDASLVERARRVCPEVEHLPPRKPPAIVSVFRALRPHQWAKNLLLLVPILTSHRFTETGVVLAGLAAFAVFCLLSSAVYVLNDAIDLDADRQHRTKRRRPFASGDLSVLYALPLALGLTVGSLLAAFFLSPMFGLVCAGYLVLTVIYSTWIKKLVLLDVYTLAALYTLRLVAGGAVTGIPISVWLAAFSIFIFLSLALCKRYAELLELPNRPGAQLPRRAYLPNDTSFVLNHGIVMMGCASLVLAVYLSSDAVTLLYRTPSLLWIGVLIVSYWGGRLWLLTSRQQMHDDPVLFALKDATSWICLMLLGVVFFAAMTVA